jgi:hypothetical protein
VVAINAPNALQANKNEFTLPHCARVLAMDCTRAMDCPCLSSRRLPKRVSTHAIESAWRIYSSVSDAFAFSYTCRDDIDAAPY